MFLESRIHFVEQWKQEWGNSPKLRVKFPSLATYLVYCASESGVFRKSKMPLERVS